MDENLQKLTEDFVTERVAYHGINATEEQSDALGNLDIAYKKMYEVLSEEHKRLLISLENAQALESGQSERYYYHAGFSDAVRFLTHFAEN